MAIIQAIFAVLMRQTGKLLNSVLGWATIMLFGKVPPERQMYLTVTGLGSVLWLVLAIGVVFPNVGAFLLALMPLPEWLDENIVRMMMLGLAIVLPLVIGLILIFAVPASNRPKTMKARVVAMLKGYPYTIGLALTLVEMAVVAPILKLRDLFKRWTTTHIAMVVEGDDYFSVVSDIQRVLEDGDITTTRERAPWLLRWPTKVFTFFAGGAVENLVADDLTMLKSPELEVLLHPADLVITGRREIATRAHALITEHLTFTKAYLTWSKEANEVEDALGSLWTAIENDTFDLDEVLNKLAEMERHLKRIKVSYEEWETLFRELLILERAVFHRSVDYLAIRAMTNGPAQPV